MNTNLKASLLFILVNFAFVCHAGNPDKRSDTQALASKKGYWVTESNIHQPNNHIVRVYDNDQKLIYVEHLLGLKLKLKSNSTKAKLKEAVDYIFEQLQKQYALPEDQGYIIKFFNS